ncbi:MAG: hypothetical protein KAS47_00610 [Candidatus Heimdallarchaeota archaeon]|nr:hypothetical protein [Candidatus Heimdallarchaeota archaeon]
MSRKRGSFNEVLRSSSIKSVILTGENALSQNPQFLLFIIIIFTSGKR